MSHYLVAVFTDGNTTVGSAFEQFPFAWLLHVADESATYVVEGKRENER